MSAHRFAQGHSSSRCALCGCAEVEAVHGGMSDIELGDIVAMLNDLDCRYALQWLATCGSAHPDGQALLRALAAVERRAGRIERERERPVTNG